MPEEIIVKTSKRSEMIDITSSVRRIVAASGMSEGTCTVFVPHTTAAVTINEKADPDVARDVSGFMETLVPPSGRFRHAEGNSDSHVKCSLIGASETIIVSGGSLLLGTWQAVFFCEFDGPRTRKCLVKVRAD